MSQQIIDVDEAGIFAEPLTAKIGGRVWTLPGDVPAPLYVAMVQVAELRSAAATSREAQEAAKDASMELHDQLLEHFRVFHPDLMEIPVPIAKIVPVMTFIYGGGAQAARQDPTPARADRSTRKATRSSRTPRPARRRAARRSRSST